MLSTNYLGQSGDQANKYVRLNIPDVYISEFEVAQHNTSGGSSFGWFNSNLGALCDTDGDGIADYLDLDSDNDGIPDIIEAGGTDPDGDGQVAYATPGDPTSMVDADGDGLWDTVDDQDNGSGGTEVSGGTPWPLTNTDGSGNPDYLDIDADDDGIVDNTEAQSTAGYIAPSGVDTDGDGLDDAYDIDCAPCGGITGVAIVPVNTGGSPAADYQDTDADGDGIPDVIEGHDTNGDGVVDGNDSPTANTGLSGGTTDADGDGLLDGFDNDTDPDNYDATNGGLAANSHPDFQGGTSERDWRENATLPVEWLGIEVELKGADAILDWTTALEINSDFFEVQRSLDGLTFQNLGNVPAAGQSDQPLTYDYTDIGVRSLATDRVYYRLRQVDIDGQFAFSPLVELSLTKIVQLDLKVYPNPTTGPVTISWTPVRLDEPASCSLTNQQEQVIKQINLDASQSQFTWEMEGLAAGSYFLRLTQGGEAETTTLIVR